MMGNETLTAINALADRLGTTSDYLVRIFAARAEFEGWTLVGFGIVAVVVASLFILNARKGARSRSLNDVEVAVFVIVAWLLNLLALALLYHGGQRLASPEAAAVKAILEAVL